MSATWSPNSKRFTELQLRTWKEKQIVVRQGLTDRSLTLQYFEGRWQSQFQKNTSLRQAEIGRLEEIQCLLCCVSEWIYFRICYKTLDKRNLWKNYPLNLLLPCGFLPITQKNVNLTLLQQQGDQKLNSIRNKMTTCWHSTVSVFCHFLFS